MRLKTIYYLILCSILVSCDRYQYKDLSPSYLKITAASLLNNTNQPVSHSFRDAWVFLQNENIGSFSIPSITPVLESGNYKLTVYPGIRYYGILSKPEIYTLIEPYSKEIDIQSNTTIEIAPVYTYKSNVLFTMDEGFETGSVFINDLDGNTASTFTRSSAISRDGKMAGIGLLTTKNNSIETSSVFFNLSQKKTAFLELDIKSDVEVSIGILSFPSKTKNYFLKLKPATDWKKIYIPLFEVLADTLESSFQIAFLSTLPQNVSEGYFAIDNVRVVSQ